MCGSTIFSVVPTKRIIIKLVGYGKNYGKYAHGCDQCANEAAGVAGAGRVFGVGHGLKVAANRNISST
jgi:hypothetical protein